MGAQDPSVNPAEKKATRPLRIAHVTPYFWPIIGGITTYVDGLASAQRALGADVRVFARLGTPNEDVEVGPSDSVRFSIWAARRLRAWNPDVVHAHAEWSALAAAQLLLGSRAPMNVFTVHTNFRPTRNGLRELLLGALLRRAAVVTTMSDASAGVLAKRFPALRRIQVCPPGSRPPAKQGKISESFDKETEFVHSHPRICAVSMMVWPEKVQGLLLLVRSMPILAQTFTSARLVIVGDGPLRNEVEAEIKSNNAEGMVTLVGSMKDPSSLISASDIFVHVSLRDTFGQVLLEAMSLGKPVVVNRETAQNLPLELRGEAMMVVETNPSAIAKGVSSLCTNEALRKGFATKGQEIVTRDFGWSRMATNMMSIYGVDVRANST